MPQPPDGGQHYVVEASGVIVQSLKRMQRQAAREGRGEDVLSAFRGIAQRLQVDPLHCGEPLYRLPTLRLQVRSIAVRPLVVDFGVSEDRRLVFLRAVTLLSAG